MLYHQYQSFKKTGKLSPTPSDIEGPFYKAGAPLKSALCQNPTLCVNGKVVDQDGNPLPALLDFWQADATGEYDQTGFDFRGKVQAQSDGQYKIETIEPGDYQIGPNEYRCSHIHVKASVDGFKLLTTQLYFNGDKYNATDHWFNPAMVIGNPNGHFDFVLERI